MIRHLPLLLVLASPTFASSEANCSSGALDALVRQGKDLYLGEIHGTTEVPALLRCLVLTALEHPNGKLIVSLEQQDSARDPVGEAWRGTDGRSSVAMWELTQFLISQEKAGRLEFHQQLPSAVLKPGESPPKYDPVEYERAMGAPLRELAARGQLIALSGNAHSRLERFPGATYDPAGKYVGPDVVHVDLMTVAGGTAWTCLSSDCGLHARPGMGAMAGEAGTLTDGKWDGHDFIYWLPGSTASPPKLSPEPPAAR